MFKLVPDLNYFSFKIHFSMWPCICPVITHKNVTDQKCQIILPMNSRMTDCVKLNKNLVKNVFETILHFIIIGRMDHYI